MVFVRLSKIILEVFSFKGEGDTALEAEAQLYSDISIDLKIMQVKECKAIRPAR